MSTGRIEKTVFISYRRTNVPWALAIYQNLTMHGFDVFFDFQSIPSGDFERVILENIKARAHFLVILTPSALERCNEPRDWLRREIETAIDEKRNVVPLMLESFDFGSTSTKAALTGKLSALSRFNGLRVYSEYFFPAMDKLRDEFLKVPLSEVALPVLPAEAQEITEIQQAAARNAEPVEKGQLTAQEWFERGYVYQEAGNWDEAIRCYTETIQRQPGFAEAYNNRGNARLDNHDLPGALADYDEAIRLKPDIANTYNNRGAARMDSHDLSGALADYDKAVQLKPDFAEAYCNRGNARMDSHDLPGALADYEEAIRLKPDFATAYNNRGNARKAKGDLPGALADYDRAIRLKSRFAEAYCNRGLVLRIRRDLDAARTDYKAALELDPDDVATRASYVAVLNELWRNSEADEQEKLVRESIQRENEYNQACFESICGNVDQAVELLKIGLEKAQSTKEWAWQDPDLQNLRSDPRFQALVQ